MIRFFTAVLIFLLSCQLYGQQALTLEEAIRYSLVHNFSIRIAQNDQKITDNNHQPGNAGMLPVIDLDANKNYTRQNIELDIQGPDG